MQARVLHRDRERRCQRGDERRVALAEASCSGVRDDQADRLLLRRQRHGEHRFLAGRRERGAHRRERRLAVSDGRVQGSPRAQRSVQRFEEPGGHIAVGGRLTPACRRAKTAVLLQEHADLLDLQELGDSIDRSLERVGEREP